MGTPLKNQNFENRASSCFKLAQIRPRAKFHDPGTFGGFGKRKHKHTNTKDSCFISIDIFNRFGLSLPCWNISAERKTLILFLSMLNNIIISTKSAESVF